MFFFIALLSKPTYRIDAFFIQILSFFRTLWLWIQVLLSYPFAKQLHSITYAILWDWGKRKTVQTELLWVFTSVVIKKNRFRIKSLWDYSAAPFTNLSRKYLDCSPLCKSFSSCYHNSVVVEHQGMTRLTLAKSCDVINFPQASDHKYLPQITRGHNLYSCWAMHGI